MWGEGALCCRSSLDPHKEFTELHHTIKYICGLVYQKECSRDGIGHDPIGVRRHPDSHAPVPTHTASRVLLRGKRNAISEVSYPSS